MFFSFLLFLIRYTTMTNTNSKIHPPTTLAAMIVSRFFGSASPPYGTGVISPQPASSEPSLQSLEPSHLDEFEMHWPLARHVNWLLWHGMVVGKILEELVRQSGLRTTSSMAISLLYVAPTTPRKIRINANIIWKKSKKQSLQMVFYMGLELRTSLF